MLFQTMKHKNFEKARQVLKRKMVNFSMLHSLATFFYSFHDSSSFFGNLFVFGSCHLNWSKFNEPENWKPNDITCFALVIQDWSGGCCPKVNFLPLINVSDVEIALVGAPIMIIEAHFEGLDNEKCTISHLLFIPFCSFKKSFQLNLFSFTENIFENIFCGYC